MPYFHGERIAAIATARPDALLKTRTGFRPHLQPLTMPPNSIDRKRLCKLTESRSRVNCHESLTIQKTSKRLASEHLYDLANLFYPRKPREMDVETQTKVQY
ncbi:hypothetical protein [Altericista sp. CCNU0014]|uniref:hypothetical protein n=1 Tax=Altericista sp. CCNU0014 TaxID=3082949 RepID=UPI003850F72F